jgi:hypothetical protein
MLPPVAGPLIQQALVRSRASATRVGRYVEAVLLWSPSTVASLSLDPILGRPGSEEEGTLPQEVLRNARDLVARGWTQGADARDSAERPVHPWDPEARSWSALGAMICGDETDRGHVAIDRLALAAVRFAEAVDTPSISKWNDEPGRSQADAVAGFTAALASAAERPESQVRHLRA